MSIIQSIKNWRANSSSYTEHKSRDPGSRSHGVDAFTVVYRRRVASMDDMEIGLISIYWALSSLGVSSETYRELCKVISIAEGSEVTAEWEGRPDHIAAQGYAEGQVELFDERREYFYYNAILNARQKLASIQDAEISTFIRNELSSMRAL